MTARRDQSGSVTLWVLGLCVAVLFLGGLSLDLWRVVAVRRDLAGMADSGARAGAAGVDPVRLRAGETALDPDRARRYVREDLAAQSDLDLVDDADIDVVDDRVVVRLRADVDLTLLQVFAPGEPIAVEVEAAAEPRRVP
jgi:hypothetical protein